ncbi:MAG: hypothetical protein L0154_30140 [Chloroflexi bacterium]|nr:hypothetical protein [Chloroflexota bacterium]
MKRFLLCVLAAILLLPQVELKAQDSASDAPYLYYYDETVRAFVVERADGTDRHLLGQELMADLPLPGTPYPNPENDYIREDTVYGGLYVDGPGWSPSGEYFAWTAAPKIWGRPPVHGEPYIINTSGLPPADVLRRFDVADMVWFPDEDKLFIVAQYNEEIPLPDREQSMGFDLTTHVHHTQFMIFDPATNTVKLLDHNEFVQRGGWNSEVEMGWVGDLIVVQNWIFENTVFYVYGKNGELLHQTEIDGQPVEQYPSMTENNLYYDENDRLHYINLLTGEEHLFGDIYPQRGVFWRGNYGILNNRYLISLADGTLTELAEMDAKNRLYHTSPWSPDGRYAIIIEEDETLYFDTQTETLHPLIDITTEHWQWLDNTRIATLGGWTPGVQDSGPQRTIIHDLSDRTSLEITGKQPLEWLEIHDTRLFFVGGGAYIYDFESDTAINMRPDADSGFSNPGGEIIVSGDWLIILENSSPTGGYFRNMGVARTDGTQRRDIGETITPSPIAIDWLPPRVNPKDLPPPVSSDPPEALVDVIHGNHWYDRVLWGEDGTITTVGSGELFSGWQMTRWSLVDGTIVSRNTIDWPSDQDFYMQDSKPALRSTEYCPNASRPEYNMCTFDGAFVLNINNETWVGTVYHDEQAICSLPVNKYDGWLRSISVTPDGKYLIVGSLVNDAYIWNLETCELALTMPDPAPGVAFSPDGKYLALGVSWDIQIWDVEALLGD